MNKDLTRLVLQLLPARRGDAQRWGIGLGLQEPRPVYEQVESDFLHRLSQTFLVKAGSGSAVIGSLWGYGEPSLFTALALG